MVVAITGASGVLGTALRASLLRDGHAVKRFVRRPPRGPDELFYDPVARALDPAALDGVDVVVNLAGAPIATRWTEAARAEIFDSRVGATAAVAKAIAACDRRPTLISGSAVGFYGDAGDPERDESAPAGAGFLADVARAWEGATEPAERAGARVVHVRTGIVLARGSGLLGALVPVFRLCLGGRVGSGRQFVPWIALPDHIAVMRHAIDATIRGPLNATAPNPARQADFARALGRVLGRPAFLPAPAAAMKLLMGQMADEMLLAGQNAVPRKALDSGYVFRHPDLEPALRAALEA